MTKVNHGTNDGDQPEKRLLWETLKNRTAIHESDEMSRSLCIRSCGRRRTKPGWVCVQCRNRELMRRTDRGRRLNIKEKFFFGLPTSKGRDRDWT